MYNLTYIDNMPTKLGKHIRERADELLSRYTKRMSAPDVARFLQDLSIIMHEKAKGGKCTHGTAQVLYNIFRNELKAMHPKISKPFLKRIRAGSETLPVLDAAPVAAVIAQATVVLTGDYDQRLAALNSSKTHWRYPTKSQRPEVNSLLARYIPDMEAIALAKLKRDIRKFMRLDKHGNNRAQSTVNSYYSSFRQEFMMVHPGATIAKNIRETKANVQKVHAEQVTAQENTVMHEITPEAMHKLVDMRHDVTSVYAMISIVMMTTGRRISEVVESDFQLGDDFKLRIGAFKKKRECQQTPTEICCLLEPEDVMLSINHVNRLLFRAGYLTDPDASLRALTRDTNRYLKSLTGDEWFSTHKLRAIYAQYMFIHRNPGLLPINQCIKRCLNHAKVSTSMRYTCAKLMPGTNVFG